MGKYIWMVVDADEYELPIAVADSARELAEILGIPQSNVLYCEWKKYNGRKIGRKFLKVLNEREEQ